MGSIDAKERISEQVVLEYRGPGPIAAVSPCLRFQIPSDGGGLNRFFFFL